MDQGIWAGLNPFEHSVHPALGVGTTIDVLVEVLSFDYTYKVNEYYFRWIEREASLL
jgi:hypothetical protein